MASTSASPTIPGIKHLIVDSSPLLTSPLASLRGMASNYLITPEVVNEMRDKKARDVLQEAEFQLVASGEQGSQSGFQVRQPSAEAIAKITAFARRTGDIAVLSTADIKVLALCLTLEMEENGLWRIREYPGQVLTGPPPKTEEELARDKEQEEQHEQAQKEKEQESKDNEVEELATAAQDQGSLAEGIEQVSLVDTEEQQAVNVTQQASTTSDNDDEDEEAEGQDEEESDDDEDGNASDSSGGSWITPDNVVAHKVKDLGLFDPVESTATAANGSSAGDQATVKPKTVMKAAVLTGDFAMQNVGIQMGLNVLGNGGKRVRNVKTWVLRCHACFKLCKDPEKRFCPSCGGPTLIRTSITYVTASPEHPQGYILHLKKNFQYKLRGTQYSLPTPKMGRAGGQGSVANPVLREDQKEWIQGVKSAEIRKDKEQRRIQKAVFEDSRRGTENQGSLGGVGSLAGFNDLDWQPEMMKGETKGRRRGGKNGAGGEVRLDSSGMPVIGAGRRNPNVSRKRK